MKQSNADAASSMTMPHGQYNFGTFEERLQHLCALFEVDPPELVYEDGQPMLTDSLMEWIKEHTVNMDWLFAGSPCALLREWTKARKQTNELMEITKKFEPEVRNAFLALLRAVTVHDVPVEEAWPLFSQVVEEFRENAQKPDLKEAG